MSFLKKLWYYALGLGLGVLMVYFFFGDRNIQCSYFPNDRVLYDLRKKELSVVEGVDTTGLDRALHEAQVDFKGSEIQDQDCPKYWLEFEAAQRRYKIENCDSIATILASEAI